MNSNNIQNNIFIFQNFYKTKAEKELSQKAMVEITHTKKIKTKSNTNTFFDRLNIEYPLIDLKSDTRETFKNRSFILLTSLLILFFITCIKYIIQTEFELASFCDINYDFDFRVNSGNITLISNTTNFTCESRCQTKGYIYSKIFQLEYYFIYFICTFYVYSLTRVVIQAHKYFYYNSTGFK